MVVSLGSEVGGKILFFEGFRASLFIYCMNKDMVWIQELTLHQYQ
jgi:hypothetical protein